MNAQVKPNEQAAMDVRLANLRAQVFEIARIPDGVEGLLDELQDAMPRLIAKIMTNHGAYDYAETGRLIHECIGGFAISLQRCREAKELVEEFLPSWRSRVEP